MAEANTVTRRPTRPRQPLTAAHSIVCTVCELLSESEEVRFPALTVESVSITTETQEVRVNTALSEAEEIWIGSGFAET